MSSAKKWFAQNLSEVENDVVLRTTAVSLSLAHLLTAYLWWSKSFLRAYSAEEAWSTCYHFFPNCQSWVSFEGIHASAILLIYAVSSAIAAILFGAPKRTRLAFTLLSAATLIKAAVFIGRYDLMGNYHVMHLLLSGVFLFSPGKRGALVFALCGLYFSAGLLKLNPEWLSGAALLRRTFLPWNVSRLALAYVVILETILVWGLLSRSFPLRFATALQLLIFHVYSWHIVGYYYPTLMILLLTPVWLPLVLPKGRKEPGFKIWTVGNWGLLLVFVAFNLIPKLQGDPALDGKLRHLSLSMLDARTTCRSLALLHDGTTTVELNFPRLSQGLRIRCDPVVFEGHLRRYCPHLSQNQTLSFALLAKRSTDSRYELIRSIRDFCCGA